MTAAAKKLREVAVRTLFAASETGEWSHPVVKASKMLLGIEPTPRPKPAASTPAPKAPSPAELRHMAAVLNAAEAEAKAATAAASRAATELREGVKEQLTNIVNMGPGFGPNGYERVHAAREALRALGVNEDAGRALEAMRAVGVTNEESGHVQRDATVAGLRRGKGV